MTDRTLFAPGVRVLSTVNEQAMVAGSTEVYDLGVPDEDGYRVIAVDGVLLLIVAETPGAVSDWEPSAFFVLDLDDPVTASFAAGSS